MQNNLNTQTENNVQNPYIYVSIETERNNYKLKVQESLNAGDVSYTSPNNLNNTLTAGINTYAISPINSKDKHSADFFSCTGVVCSGVSNDTGKKISFLSHQDSLKVLYKYKEKFSFDLETRLKQMLIMSYKGTIDIGIFGGDIGNCDVYLSDYGEIIMMIRTIIKKILGINVEVIIGPNYNTSDIETDDDSIMEHSSHFYYKNNSSILYSYKPKQKNDTTNVSFLAHDLYDVVPYMKKELLEN